MKAQTLKPEKIDQAYALIQVVMPHIPLESWRAFANSLLSRTEAPESGILAVEDPGGYVMGMVGYVIDHDLEHGQTLLAKNFISLDGTIKGKEAVAYALIGALEDLARQKGCGHIRTIVHEPEAALRDAWIIDVLKGSGHHTEARRFIKAVRRGG